MKKIDLSKLPKLKNGSYDWEASIGMKLQFWYEDICDEIEIIGYQKRGNKVKIKYHDRERSYNYSRIIYCSFSDILDNKNSYRFLEGEIIKDFLILEPLLVNSNRAYRVQCQKCFEESIIEQTRLINVMPRCLGCKKLKEVKDHE